MIRRAIKARAHISVFNDAGVGIEGMALPAFRLWIKSMLLQSHFAIQHVSAMHVQR